MEPTNFPVLVIDDDAELLEWSCMALEGAGYSVRPAGDAESALKILQKERFQVAVVDLMMPGKDGLDFAAEFKKGDPFREVVLMSGQRSLETAMKAIREGVIAYLVKPFSENDLAAAVEKAFARIRLTDGKKS